MADLPSQSMPTAADIRRRLQAGKPTATAVLEPPASPSTEAAGPTGGRSTANIPRPKRTSGTIPRPTRDLLTRTPLPADLALSNSAIQEELAKLRVENVELRSLIEQAIAQEEENERRNRAWMERDQELMAEVVERERRITNLAEQVNRLKVGAGDAGELIVQLQEKEDAVRLLSEQVRQLEEDLSCAQESGQGANVEDYVKAVQERDQEIETLNLRVIELEEQIANTPPPPPTDEELAKMADELERERCQFNRLRKEIEDERKAHADDVTDFERQMREMEVQMSKERADMARQRTELNRMMAEVRSEMEAVQRGDDSIRDRLAQLKQRGPAAPAANNGAGPATPAEKDAGFMSRLFGKR